MGIALRTVGIASSATPAADVVRNAAAFATNDPVRLPGVPTGTRADIGVGVRITRQV